MKKIEMKSNVKGVTAMALAIMCSWVLTACSIDTLFKNDSGDKGDDEGGKGDDKKEEVVEGYPEAEKLGVTVNEKYLNLDWEECQALYCDTLRGEYKFKSAKSVDIEQGTVFQIWNDQDCYIIVATQKAEKNGDVYTVKGELGDLSDIFSSCEIHLATKDDGNTRATTPIITPIAEDYTDANGKRQWKTLTRSKYPKLDLLNLSYEKNDVILFNKAGQVNSSSGASASYDVNGKINYFSTGIELMVGIDMTFDKAEEEKVEDAIFKRIRARSFEMEFYADASMWSKLNMSISADVKAKVEQDVKVWKTLMPEKSFMFLIGEIPVVVSIGADLCTQIEATTETNLKLETGYEAEGHFRSGARYKQEDNSFEPYTTQGFDFKYTPLRITGKGDLQSKIHLFPQINLTLYKTISPYIQLKPYLKTDFAYKSQTTVGGNTGGKDYSGQSLEILMGLDTRIGLDLKTPWKRKKLLQLKTKDINLAEHHLYKSPYSLKRMDKNLVTYGNSNELTFKVFDMDYVKGEEIPSELHPMLTLQSRDSERTLAIKSVDKDGETWEWEPKSENDILYARVYDGEGHVALEHQVVTFKPNFCPDDHHPHFVDLGLPTGTLWCCCNVGASSPFQYGDYFPWAVTDKNARFGDKNYPFYKYSDSRYWEDDHFYYPEKVKYTIPEADIQGTKYDAATVNMGSMFVTPNREQITELRDSCHTQFIIHKGKKGTLVVGPNSNCLFLPLGGMQYSFGSGSVGGRGYYMSSTSTVSKSGTFTYEQLGGNRPSFYQMTTTDRIQVGTLNYPTDGFNVRPVIKR